VFCMMCYHVVMLQLNVLRKMFAATCVLGDDVDWSLGGLPGQVTKVLRSEEKGLQRRVSRQGTIHKSEVHIADHRVCLLSMSVQP
jgi:hypothetical protein